MIYGQYDFLGSAFSRAVQTSFSSICPVFPMRSLITTGFLGSTSKFSSICPDFLVLHLLTTDFLGSTSTFFSICPYFHIHYQFTISFPGSTSKFFSICPDFHIHYQFTISFPGSTSKFSSICPKSTIIIFLNIKDNIKMYLNCILQQAIIICRYTVANTFKILHMIHYINQY